MPLPAALRTQCNTYLTTLRAAMRASQDSFRPSNGRYWQALQSHSTRPADGAVTVSDRRAAAPSDHPGDTWQDRALIAAAAPCMVSCIPYEGPRGQGWELLAEVQAGTEVWRRRFNTGPEANRDQDWHRVR